MAMVNERLDWLLSRNGKLTERSGKKTKGRGSSFIRFFLLTCIMHMTDTGVKSKERGLISPEIEIRSAVWCD